MNCVVSLYLCELCNELVTTHGPVCHETMKCLYRQLLRKLLLYAEDIEGVVVQHKKINLKDCSNMVAEVWNLVKPEILRRAWNKLRGISTEEEEAKEKSNMESRRN